MGTSWIIVAWTTLETRFIGTYGVRIGRAFHPEDYEEVLVPHAVTWSRQGSKEEVARAREWAKKDKGNDDRVSNYSVFTYETREQDPLNRGRADILKAGRRTRREGCRI